MNFVTKFLDTAPALEFVKHFTKWKTVLLLLIILGLEQLFEDKFRCPCTQPESANFALLCFIGPAVILFWTDLLTSNSASIICYGCCETNGCCIKAKYGCCTWYKIKNFSMLIIRSSVAPAAWIFMALLDADYYICYESEEPCADSPLNNVYKTRCQVTSGIILVSTVSAIALGYLLYRCFQGQTYLRWKYMRTYQEIEETQMNEFMMNHATQLAVSNLRAFFHKIEASDEKTATSSWDEITKVQNNDVLHMDEERKNGFCYSHLHKCVSKNHTSPTYGAGVENVKEEERQVLINIAGEGVTKAVTSDKGGKKFNATIQNMTTSFEIA